MKNLAIYRIELTRPEYQLVKSCLRVLEGYPLQRDMAITLALARRAVRVRRLAAK